MTSVYRWQGKVETAEEWRCFIKTSRDRYGDIEQVIQEFHSYELPGILALPLTTGSVTYLNWIEQETRDSRPSNQVEQDEEAISKAHLIQDLASAHEQLIEAAISAHQRGGTRQDDIWGPREVLAHMAGWEEMAVSRIPRIVAGMPPIHYASEAQHTAMDDAINETVVAVIGEQSFETVCGILRKAYQRDVEMLNGLDEEFFRPDAYVY